MGNKCGKKYKVSALFAGICIDEIASVVSLHRNYRKKKARIDRRDACPTGGVSVEDCSTGMGVDACSMELGTEKKEKDGFPTSRE